ncbi:unnamed protein product, partial [Ectocarpus sp. 6 AP-2014]
MPGCRWRCRGGAGSSSISDRDRSNKHRRSRDSAEEAVAGAAARGGETVGRNERQKSKRPRNGVRVAIKNEGGAAAIATTGSHGTGAGAVAPAASRAGDVMDVSEDSRGGASPRSTGRVGVPVASKPVKRGGAKTS